MCILYAARSKNVRSHDPNVYCAQISLMFTSEATDSVIGRGPSLYLNSSRNSSLASRLRQQGQRAQDWILAEPL
jgi:hypothetical protein